ncbi:hypothetical protein [Chondromyces crocatus]|uniref:CARDB domain-containing protein n=1 Tax=Chondromyces crocatus TaxID=52 RepID=A0A0K1EPP4_CHOCO|nr:hypothetical protein [Chondromyces crocatus]AKT42895.1 uncharacterized protein CMC5_071230 [Chondromyces crocatus]
MKSKSAALLMVSGILSCWGLPACLSTPAEMDSRPLGDDGPGTPPPDLRPDVIAVSVLGPTGALPVKGDMLELTLAVQNLGAGSGTVTLRPLLTSARFNDFVDVSLEPITFTLGGRETREVSLSVEPIVIDAAKGKHFALNRGDYDLSGVIVDVAGEPLSVDTDFLGAAFTIAPSDVVFSAVVYDASYFERIGYDGTPETYMREAFDRATEVFTPESPGSSEGTYTAFDGFDDMMGVRQIFHAVGGLAASSAGGGFCEQVGAHARAVFGLTRDWDIDEANGNFTDPDHHGFDLLVGLTPEMGGGATCGWLGVQVSGQFGSDRSLDRSQLVVVHETGHLFGAPHCDPLQGYVMCGGEQHPHYVDDKIFVWHQVSLDVMQNRWR